MLKFSEEEKRWMAEDDAYTLARAEAIKKDEERMNAASEAAKRMAEDQKERAKNQVDQAKAMERIAKGKKGGNPNPTPPPRSKTPRAETSRQQRSLWPSTGTPPQQPGAVYKNAPVRTKKKGKI
jgi:hypothetical protein